VVVITVSAGAVTVAAGVVTVSGGVVTVTTTGGVVTVTGSPGIVTVTVTGLESVLPWGGAVSVVDCVVRVVAVGPVRVPVRSVRLAEPLPLPQLVSSTLDNTPRTPTTSSFAAAAVYADDRSLSQRLTISRRKHRPAIRHPYSEDSPGLVRHSKARGHPSRSTNAPRPGLPLPDEHCNGDTQLARHCRAQN
jgi:hypothetical protein